MDAISFYLTIFAQIVHFMKTFINKNIFYPNILCFSIPLNMFQLSYTLQKYIYMALGLLKYSI